MRVLTPKIEIQRDQVICANKRDTGRSEMGVGMNLMEEWLSDGRNRGWGLKSTCLTKIKLTWAGGDTLESSNTVQSFANNTMQSIDVHTYPIYSTRKALLKIS